MDSSYSENDDPDSNYEDCDVKNENLLTPLSFEIQVD